MPSRTCELAKSELKSDFGAANSELKSDLESGLGSGGRRSWEPTALGPNTRVPQPMRVLEGLVAGLSASRFSSRRRSTRSGRHRIGRQAAGAGGISPRSPVRADRYYQGQFWSDRRQWTPSPGLVIDCLPPRAVQHEAAPELQLMATRSPRGFGSISFEFSAAAPRLCPHAGRGIVAGFNGVPKSRIVHLWGYGSHTGTCGCQ